MIAYGRLRLNRKKVEISTVPAGRPDPARGQIIPVPINCELPIEVADKENLFSTASSLSGSHVQARASRYFYLDMSLMICHGGGYIFF